MIPLLCSHSIIERYIMHKHHGRHHDRTHHAHLLMFGPSRNRAGGGPASNSMPSNTPIYKKGGKTRHHRRHHDDGGLTGVSPITGMRSPDIVEKRHGGSMHRARHAEGDVVAVPYRRGGKPSHHRKRHADGDGVSSMMKRPLLGRMLGRIGAGMGGYAAGGYADGGEMHTADLLKRGGDAHHRRKKKHIGRQHHSFGDVVNGFLNAAGTVAPFLPMLLAEGGEATYKASGGAAKVRRGMLSKSGKILNSPIHAKACIPLHKDHRKY
jgi:hypothetical protein